ALEAKRKADEAVQRKLDEEEIELPPDIAEYQTRTPPSKVGDDTHQPGGELHSIAAKEEEQLPEPPLETDSDAGGVPLSYGNVSYIKGAPGRLAQLTYALFAGRCGLLRFVLMRTGSLLRPCAGSSRYASGSFESLGAR